MSNNAFERAEEHLGPRMAAAQPSWPAAQLDRSAASLTGKSSTIAANGSRVL